MKVINIISKETGSFKDPSGFIFFRDEEMYRQINYEYKENYEHLLNSGLYEELVSSNLLIPHEEVPLHLAIDENAYKVIKPQIINFISYSYEWSFSQIKDAALLTLAIQKIALKYNMTLKDASAFNIQYKGCKPIFIDTLSFEQYKEGTPWVAYKQFCEHFLSPLVLSSKKDVRLNQLLKIYLDGIPLDLVSKLLPISAYLDFSVLSHVIAHSFAQNYFSDKQNKTKSTNKMSKSSLLDLIESLQNLIEKLKWLSTDIHWLNYYNDTNYSDLAFREKEKIVSGFVRKANSKTLLDIGANTGHFSRLVSGLVDEVISVDSDYSAVEENHQICKEKKIVNVLPLILDFINPTPSTGWANEERKSFLDRVKPDTIIALALVHHLAISKNIPFEKIASRLSAMSKHLIIEFIPKSDSQVQRLLQTRKDIFVNYTQSDFEAEFKKCFHIVESVNIPDSERSLYLMRQL